MSIYYCKECCERIDNNYHPMHEGEICPECYFEIEDRKAARQYEIEQRLTHQGIREAKARGERI